MSYKLPEQPHDTPLVNEAEWASNPDSYGMISGLVSSRKAREIERDLNKTKAFARRLLQELRKLELDDSGRDLVEEAECELQ